MKRRLLSLTILSTVVTTMAVWFQWGKMRWRREICRLQDEVSDTTTSGLHTLTPPPRSQAFEDLPPVIQRYLTAALGSKNMDPPPSNLLLHGISFEQSGRFRLSPEQSWLPFTGHQVLTRTGFVWDATIAMLLFGDNHHHHQEPSSSSSWWRWMPSSSAAMTLHVVDALTPQQAVLQANMNYMLPLAKQHDQITKTNKLLQTSSSDLVMGERLRWLAEAVLLPHLLHPSVGLVHWKEVAVAPNEKKEHQAMATVIATGEEMIFDFVEEEEDFSDNNTSTSTTRTPKETHHQHMPTSVFALRPKGGPDGKSFEWTPWKGFFGNYVTLEMPRGGGTVTIPTHMECGWMPGVMEEKGEATRPEQGMTAETNKESLLELYFAADLHSFAWDYMQGGPPVGDGTRSEDDGSSSSRDSSSRVQIE